MYSRCGIDCGLLVNYYGLLVIYCVFTFAPGQVRKNDTFTTLEDFQTEIDVAIYEGERSTTEGNNMLGTSPHHRTRRMTGNVTGMYHRHSAWL